MRVLLAAALLAGLSVSPVAAQWSDDDRPPARRGTGIDRCDVAGPCFGDDRDDGARDLDRRDRADIDRRGDGRPDPDEIMPRRRDRDRSERDHWRDDRSRADRYDPRYDRYAPPPYGPPAALPPAPGGVFVVPPPIPGARSY